MRALLALVAFAAAAAAFATGGSTAAGGCSFFTDDDAAAAMAVTPGTEIGIKTRNHGWGSGCTFSVDDASGPRAMTAILTNPGHGLALLKARAQALCLEDKTLCRQMERAVEEDEPVQAMGFLLRGLDEVGAVHRLTGFGGNPAFVWSSQPGGHLNGSLAYVYVLALKGERFPEHKTRAMELFCYRLRKSRDTSDPACVEHAARLVYLKLLATP